MRGARSLLLLLVIALGLGAYIYFVESERDLTDPETRKEKIFAVETGKIEELELRAASGETTTLRKNGESWQIVAPVTAAADDYTVNSLVSTVETMEMQRSLDDNPASVATYGLEPPRMSVAFKLAGDATPRRLNIGNKTPTGADLYARVEGQPRLFLVAGFLEDTLSRTTFDLRDKDLLKVSRDGIDAVRLEPAGAPAVALARTASEWRLTAPFDTRADASTVDALIGQVTQSKMKAVVGGEQGPMSPADLQRFGLDKPSLVLVLGSGSTRASLALGNKQDDSSVYARDLSKPLVFTVDASLVSSVNKPAADFRLKDIFAFKSYTATGVDITRDGTTASFGKSKPAGGDANAADVWTQTKPEARDVNQTGMTDLLNTLSSMRADQFVPTALASGDDTVVVARFGDAAKPTEERVTFRRSGNTVQAIRPGEPGAAVVPAADVEKALTQLKELTGSK